MRNPVAFLFAASLLSLIFSPRPAQADSSPTQEVRKILTDHCLKCHGGEKTKGEFDLTTREGLLHPGAEGPNVVPGNSKASRLVKLIRHEDDPTMPAKADKLPEADIETIARWIDAGAPYDKPLIEKNTAKRNRATVTDEDRKFWAFTPLQNPAPPATKNTNWPRTDIDRFILAKLEEKNLTPNNPADRRKLIRRATLDLTGLPPTPQDVESFVNNPDPQAYEKLIDKLLASPQYGERWARHWLDLARFAESHGYEHDYDRYNAYHYRDFVIRALNADMPYDHFVKLQIAGDEIEPQNAEAIKATGFLAAGTHATQITAATAEKERYDELDDMASTITTSMLALTAGCARCHDHKYDPIPTKDYYRLVATFTTTVRSEIELEANPENFEKQKQQYQSNHAKLAAALSEDETKNLPARYEKWLATNPRIAPPAWISPDFTSAVSKGGATLTRQPDNSYLATGQRPEHDTYVFTTTTNLKNITAIKLEALADPSLVKKGPGRADNGNFALSNFTVTAKSSSPEPTLIKLKNPRATFEQKNLPIAATIDADPVSSWAVDPKFGKDHAALWELESPLNSDAPVTLTFTLTFNNNTGHAIGRPRLSLTTAPLPANLDASVGSADAIEINKLLDKPQADRSPADHAKLQAYYKSIDPIQLKLTAALRDDQAKAPQPQKYKVFAASEGVPPVRLHTSLPDVPDFYPKSFFLKRGDPNAKEGEATAGFLQVLNRAPNADEQRWRTAPPKDSKLSYRRTALANWLTDVDQGAGNLLARVIVNRLWQHHMGRGIVATPNDFGQQGAKPTHPQLLDYLATKLTTNNWQLKTIHKLIMTSSVYMQSTDYDEARAAVDRDNTLWWRRQPIRLEGEAIRDSILAVSGQLDPTMFGQGTLEESMRRRSIYFFVKRSKLIPIMMLFDWPDSLQGLGQRSTTTVAPQALAMMNHPQIQSYAAAFAKRLSANNATPRQIVQNAYQSALSRNPTSEELQDSLSFLQEQTDRYKKDNAPNPSELAVNNFCQAILSLNEFIYID